MGVHGVASDSAVRLPSWVWLTLGCTLWVAACADSSEADTADTGSDAEVALEVDDGQDADGQDTDAVSPGCLGPQGRDDSGTATLGDPLGTASVTIDDRAACVRTYRLASTATRRDDLPPSPRVVVERAEAPTLRTGHDLFDALYALALDEVRENSVAAITDGSFNQGKPLACPAGGCFETGRKWPWVWTRDTSYAVALGLADLDPIRARNSLVFKLSERRAGGDRQIVQDTGSGGSWPVSTDRVVWALGARAVVDALDGEDRLAFRDLAIEALTNTLEQDRKVIWDAASGLYFGEQSFLDWREQSYPAWTQHDVIDIATSRCLSTNVLHLRALEVTAELLSEASDARATRYTDWARDLKLAINRHLWLPDDNQYSSFLPTQLDPTPVRRFDLLGSALAILTGVADPARAAQMLASYPAYGPGVPVLWPQQQQTVIYHNRASWPFVTAFWLRAARLADLAAGANDDASPPSDGVADHLVDSLVRAAALNLSNMENLEAGTGAPWLDDGTASGPVVNSQRQLWSVAGFVSMVHQTIFGLEVTAKGLVVRPWLTRHLRDSLFAATDTLVLRRFPFHGRAVTVVVHLPPVGSGGRYRVTSMTMDSVSHIPAIPIRASELGADSLVEVTLVADVGAPTRPMTLITASNWRAIYSPRTPAITAIKANAGKLELTLWTNEDDRQGLSFDVFRDGVRVAADLPGTTTSWTDPVSDASAPTSPCYVVAATFDTGTHSQRSRATCWWGEGDAHIQIVDASQFRNVGGTGVTEYGRFHFQGWGDPGHRLDLDVTATRSGPHLFQVSYGNGAGPLNTGIACGTKRLTVTDRDSGAVVADGVLVMPQLGRWDRWALSNFVAAELVAGHRYDVAIIADATVPNMSDFAAFATYNALGASGGTAGPVNRVNISELRILAR